jgi:hypothetical protein
MIIQPSATKPVHKKPRKGKVLDLALMLFDTMRIQAMKSREAFLY